MIRLLVVQNLYNLSDEAMECQLLDRASFQRFAVLSAAAGCRMPRRCGYGASG